MFSLESNLQGATLTLRLTGNVLIPDVVSFNDKVREHSKTPGITQLVMDLSQAGKMDLSGLGALVSLNTSMLRYGRRLVLMRIPDHIENLLKKAEIEGFFASCESEEELKGFFIQPQRRPERG